MASLCPLEWFSLIQEMSELSSQLSVFLCICYSFFPQYVQSNESNTLTLHGRCVLFFYAWEIRKTCNWLVRSNAHSCSVNAQMWLVTCSWSIKRKHNKLCCVCHLEDTQMRLAKKSFNNLLNIIIIALIAPNIHKCLKLLAVPELCSAEAVQHWKLTSLTHSISLKWTAESVELS